MAQTALPLVTPRLVLDRLVPGDAEALRRIVTLPEVGRMLFIFGADFARSEALLLIAAQSDPARRPLRLALRRAPGAPLLGTIGVGAGAEPDIYYFLDPEAAGQGLMRAALGAFLPFARAQFGLSTFGAKVFTDNPASARVLEAQGFRRVGEDVVKSAQRAVAAPVWLYRREGPALPEVPGPGTN